MRNARHLAGYAGFVACYDLARRNLQRSSYLHWLLLHQKEPKCHLVKSYLHLAQLSPAQPSSGQFNERHR